MRLEAALEEGAGGGVLPGGTVTFAAGQTSQTITVNVTSDSAVELDETFTVSLSAPSAGATLGAPTASGTILNDDALLSIAALAARRAEGQSGSTALTFTVTRSGDTSIAHSTKYAVTGSGAAPANATDFAGGVLPGGTVSFAAGQTSQTVTINIAGDSTVEPDEGFTVTLSAPSTGATLGSAVALGIILSDDTSLSIARLSAQKVEGHSGTTPFTFTVTRSGGATGTASANWAVTGGGVSSTTAANGADFAAGQLPNGQVNFAARQTSQTVTVNVAGDTAAELNESFTVTLSGAQAGVAIGTASAVGIIYNDDFVSTSTNQTLVGTNNADVFLLGGGLDSVTGGGGLDQFLFQPAALGNGATNATTLQDFRQGAGEVINLSTIDAIAGTVADNAFTFIGNAPFSGVAGQLRWQDQGAARLIQGDINGDSVSDLTIFVKAAGPVDANWFVL